MAERSGPGMPTGPAPAGKALPAPPGGRRRSVLVGVAALVVVLVGLTFDLDRPRGAGPSSTPSASTSNRAPSGLSSPPDGSPEGSVLASLPGPRAGFLTSSAELRQRAALAAQGVQPFAEAVADLLSDARPALDAVPHPEARLEIPGTTGPFVDDTATAYGLALAYGVTGQPDYASQSARYIMAWVDTTISTTNACPDTGACQTSLIMSRTAPGFVFAASLLGDSGQFPADDAGRFRTWLRTIVLPSASLLDNNWGDAGTFTRLAVTAYLGDAAGFASAVAKWRAQQDLVAADGHIPLEVRRGSLGIGYTQEALDYKVAGAEIAGRQGIDLWDYRGAGGATLRDAVTYLAGYWFDPDAWPWYAHPESPPVSGMWEIAYEHWPTPAWQPIIEQRRPYGAQGHSAVRWTTLTNGLPFDTPATAAAPTP